MSRSSSRRDRKPRSLKEGELAELLVYGLELTGTLYDPAASRTNVIYDARICNAKTGKTVQIDVAVASMISGRPYLRIIEVRDRQSPQGPRWVTEIDGLIDELGAHRATLVSTGGFTSTAIERIRASEFRLDAFQLRIPCSEAWPKMFASRSLRLRGPIVKDITFAHRQYINVLTNQVEFDVMYGLWSEQGAVFAILIAPQTSGGHRRIHWTVLDKHGSNEFDDFSLEFEYSDGTRGKVASRLRRRPIPTGRLLLEDLKRQ